MSLRDDVLTDLRQAGCDDPEGDLDVILDALDARSDTWNEAGLAIALGDNPTGSMVSDLITALREHDRR